MRCVSTPHDSTSRFERLERALVQALLLGSPWRPYSPRALATGALFFGVLNVLISVPMLLYAE